MKKLILIFSILLAFLIPANAFAEDSATGGSSGSGGGKSFDACKHVISGQTAVCSGGSAKAEDIAKNVISVLFWLIGTAAVIVIIYAGITYIAASGDASKLNRAKTMLIYAVAGLAVAILAYAITNFIVGVASGNGANGAGGSNNSQSSESDGENSTSGSNSSSGSSSGRSGGSGGSGSSGSSRNSSGSTSNSRNPQNSNSNNSNSGGNSNNRSSGSTNSNNNQDGKPHTTEYRPPNSQPQPGNGVWRGDSTSQI